MEALDKDAARVSDLACQPPILICVGTFQSSFAAGRGIRPCMPAPHPNLCGCLPIIMCRQQRYQTLHGSPPSQFVWVPSNHHVLPAQVSDLVCQPRILICVGALQPSFAASRGITPCMPAPHPDFSVQIPSIFRFRRRWQTLHAISQAPKEESPSSGFLSTISEHNFQAFSGTRASSNLACKHREHVRNRGQHQNFRARLEHGLPWVTVFGPTSLDWGPKNSTKGRAIQESTGNPQIAKLLASQEKISRGGVLRHVRAKVLCNPCILGGPNKGEKIKSGRLTPAFSGAQGGVAVSLRTPCILFGIVYSLDPEQLIFFHNIGFSMVVVDARQLLRY